MTIFLPGSTHPSEVLDASQLHDKLWQGGYPPCGPILSDLGFGLVVLCAVEYQPPARKFPGVTVWSAPNTDNEYMPIPQASIEVAQAAAQKVVNHIERGESVLVTCWAGINRSSFVSALALHKLLGISGTQICALIRLQRPGTLTNSKFVEYLSSLPAKT